MFGGLMKALGAPLHMGGKFNPMNSSNKFINPANMLGGAGQKMGLAPPDKSKPQMGMPQQGQPIGGGLGPSMQAVSDMANKMGYGGMKPPSMGQEGRNMGVNMGGMNSRVPPSAYFPPNKSPVGAPNMGGNGGFNSQVTNMYGEQAQQPQGGIGPSMDAMSSMMQQQPGQLMGGIEGGIKSPVPFSNNAEQAPEAMQPMPDFMNQSQDRMKMY